MEGRPGFVIAPWCGAADCEAQIKTDTQATIRNMPIDGAAPARAVRPLRQAGARPKRGSRSPIETDRGLTGGARPARTRALDRASASRFLDDGVTAGEPSRATIALEGVARDAGATSRIRRPARSGPEVRRGQRFEARAVADHRHRGQEFDRQRLVAASSDSRRS